MDYKINKIQQYYINQGDNKNFIKNIENLGPRDVNEIFKKSYIPKIKTKEEILKDLKYKKCWKSPGYLNGEFNPINSLKPKILTPWEQSRVDMPVRSYETYPVKEHIKNDLIGKEFGFADPYSNTTEQYKIYLKDRMDKFSDFVQRPSKYTKPQKFLPSILLDKPPFYVKKSETEEFRFSKHNTFIYENRFRSDK